MKLQDINISQEPFLLTYHHVLIFNYFIYGSLDIVRAGQLGQNMNCQSLGKSFGFSEKRGKKLRQFLRILNYQFFWWRYRINENIIQSRISIQNVAIFSTIELFKDITIFLFQIIKFKCNFNNTVIEPIMQYYELSKGLNNGDDY
ncbi:unnamed protein product [Paramecium sonneborni]|uniref:Uncharacterized protein n=1 Tax=Paramecium sonneborni TaxID=65129 RepID=A0A8S1L1Q7_9CILI|nr:unnamed protein product [Paramecium sonneborni]